MRRFAAVLLAFALLAVAEPSAGKTDSFKIVGANINVDVIRNGDTLPATLVPYLVPGDTIRISFPKGVQFSRSPRWHLVAAYMYKDYLQHAPTFPIFDADLSHAPAGHSWDVAYDGSATPLFFLIPEDGSRYGRGIPDARNAIEDLGNRPLLRRTAMLSASAAAKQSTMDSFLRSLSSIQPGELSDGRARVVSATQSLFGYDLGGEACFTTGVVQTTQYACAAQAISTGYTSAPSINVTSAIGTQLSVNAATYGMLIGALYQLLAKRRVAAHYTFIPGVLKPGSDSTDVFVDQQPAYDATAAQPSTIVYFEIGSKATSLHEPAFGPAPALPVCIADPAIELQVPFSGLPIYFRSHRMLISTSAQTYDVPAQYDPLRGFHAQLTDDQYKALANGGSATVSSLWGFEDFDSSPVNVIEPHAAKWQLQTSKALQVVAGAKSGSLTFSDGNSGMGSCVQSVSLTDGLGRTIPVTHIERTNDTVTATFDASTAGGAAGTATIAVPHESSTPLQFTIYPALPAITRATAYLPKGVLVLQGTGLKYIDTVTLLNTGIVFGSGTPNADGSWTFSSSKPAAYQPAWEHQTMAISYTLLPPDPRTNAVEADVEYAPSPSPSATPATAAPAAPAASGNTPPRR